MIEQNGTLRDRLTVHDDELNSFCTSVCSEAGDDGLIVAIARKMPRLLEYTSVMHDTRCPVVSERALPWLDKKQYQSRVLVFCDDILNVGSTVDHHATYAEKHLGTRSTLRIFAHRKKMSPLQQRLSVQDRNVSVQTEFDEDLYWEFETELPQRLLTLGKPYDIDFPLLYQTLTEDASDRSSEEWLRVLRERFSSVWDLTIPRQSEAGILSFSVVDPIGLPRALSTSEPTARHMPPPKLRIYISRPDRQAVLVPMWIPAIATDALMTGSALPSDLRNLWMECSNQAMMGCAFECEPQYNLLSYLLSFEYLRQLMPSLGGVFSQDGAACAPIIKEADVVLLFGPLLGHHICSQLCKLFTHSDKGNRHVVQQIAHVNPETAINPELVNEIGALLQDSAVRGLSPSKVFREIFRILDGIVQGNDPDPTEGSPGYMRLRLGVPLCDLWLLIKRYSNRPTISLEEMSYLLDYFIDLGAVVPIVERIHDVYIRSYRRGEADPIEMAQVVHGLLKLHEEMFPDRPMKKTAFTKILAAMAVYHRDLLPLEPVFEFHGMVPFVRLEDVMGEQFEEAVEFLHRKNVIRIHQLRPPKDDNQMMLGLGLET